jgi:hypothetical protein
LIELMRLFVDDSAVTVDLHSITVMTLIWRHELYAAVAVPMVVPVRK